MAILDPTDANLVADLDTPSACAFCSAPAMAFWVGAGQTVFCCARCAVATLPQLCADAAVASAPSLADAARHAGGMLDRFRAEYWRAVALAVPRRRA